MDITIITPTTNNPVVNKNIKSVKKNRLGSRHWVIGDGYQYTPINHYKGFDLVENTGSIDGKTVYYGARVYAGVSFFVNTRWVYFLDEDNHISDDFAEKLAPFLERHSKAPAVTFRRKLFNSKGVYLGNDDFESIPSNFSDTGCTVWNTRFFATKIAPHMAFHGWGEDRLSYNLLRNLIAPLRTPHLKEYLLHYTLPDDKLGEYKKVIAQHENME